MFSRWPGLFIQPWTAVATGSAALTFMAMFSPMARYGFPAARTRSASVLPSLRVHAPEQLLLQASDPRDLVGRGGSGGPEHGREGADRHEASTSIEDRARHPDDALIRCASFAPQPTLTVAPSRTAAGGA